MVVIKQLLCRYQVSLTSASGMLVLNDIAMVIHKQANMRVMMKCLPGHVVIGLQGTEAAV